MASSVLKTIAKDMEILIESVHIGALGYCKLDLRRKVAHRQAFLTSGDVYMNIELGDELGNGRIITAIPISSCSEFDLDSSKDFVFMDCRESKYAIEANLQCMIEGIKTMFITLTDKEDSKDMLLWKILKPS